MTTNTIKTMSKATVDYIANKLNCTATKAELVKQLKAQPEALETAYTEAKAQQTAEADSRKKQKAEELAKKAEALAKAEQKQKAEQQKDSRKKQKQTKEQKTKEQKQKTKEAEAEKLSDIKAQYRKNSLQLNEQQAELLTTYINDFEIMRWKCNKNMITLYYKNKQVIEIVASTRALRISTKEAFATSTYETRKSGYGVDFTKKLKDEKALTAELKALVERVKKQTAKAEADKQKKADKQTAKKQKEDK